MSVQEGILSFVISVGASIFTHLLIVYNDKYQLLKKIAENKIIKIVLFILLYILPIVTITLMIAENKTEPTFRNIALLIIICVTLVYNILMSHIIRLYKMNGDLAKISSEKLTKIDQTFDKVYKHTEKMRTDNNLK